MRPMGKPLASFGNVSHWGPLWGPSGRGACGALLFLSLSRSLDLSRSERNFFWGGVIIVMMMILVIIRV